MLIKTIKIFLLIHSINLICLNLYFSINVSDKNLTDSAFKDKPDSVLSLFNIFEAALCLASLTVFIYSVKFFL